MIFPETPKGFHVSSHPATLGDGSSKLSFSVLLYTPGLGILWKGYRVQVPDRKVMWCLYPLITSNLGNCSSYLHPISSCWFRCFSGFVLFLQSYLIWMLHFTCWNDSTCSVSTLRAPGQGLTLPPCLFLLHHPAQPRSDLAWA
jgi:hypothetical protein